MANPDPTINFQVDLTLNMAENIGSLTNLSSQSMLHPDRHQNNQNTAISDIAQRNNHLSTWIPGLSGADNRPLKHGDTFTAYGLNAIYLRDMYTGTSPKSGMAILKVV